MGPGFLKTQTFYTVLKYIRNPHGPPYPEPVLHPTPIVKHTHSAEPTESIQSFIYIHGKYLVFRNPSDFPTNEKAEAQEEEDAVTLQQSPLNILPQRHSYLLIN